MARPLRNRDHNRDHILLGLGPRDPFASTAAAAAALPPGSPFRYSDVDFSDVFGGPPRRSSVQQARHGHGDSAAAYASGGIGGGGGVTGGETVEARRPWSCSFGEKPVFGGGVGSPTRWGQLGNDFFDDIFRGSESPRKVDRDLFSSTPSSTALSPARPLPLTGDEFSRGSPLSAQLSFSARLVKSSDDLAFRSPTADVVYENEKSMPDAFGLSSPAAYAPTNASRLVQAKGAPKNDSHAVFDKSALHHQTLHSQCRSLEGTKLARSEMNDTERQSKIDSSGLQAYSDSGYFHFSMYKWPSIGVTLVLPYNLKERTKSRIKVSGASAQILQAADCPTDDQAMPQGCRIFHNQCDLENKSPLSDLAPAEIIDISLTKGLEEALPASFDTKSIRSDITDKSDTCSKDDVSVPVEAWKPKLKNLPNLVSDSSDKEGDKEITGQAENKESLVIDSTTRMKDANDTAKFEQATGENMPLGHIEKATKKMHDTLATREDKMIGSRVKGKVKEFIKIFNQEATPRSGGTIENQVRRPRTRNEAKGRLEARVSARVANTDEYEEKVDNEALSTPSKEANQDLGIGQKPASDKFLSMQEMDDSCSEEKGISSLSSDAIPDILDASFCNIEEAYIENIDECLVEVPQNQNEVSEADLQKEEIKASDAKIREWSKGKEGNIRSLLSTLQYVLWPGSGWKPIPLVDIIEGTSVRRAYQKALLCLHPDKLQQKGVEMHQKFIAEKVFDILQDAWTHFNSVSSL